MAEFEMKCPYCGSPWTVQDEWIGMKVECAKCQKSFAVAKAEPIVEALPKIEQIAEQPVEEEKFPSMPNIPSVPPGPPIENNISNNEYSNKTRTAYLLFGIFLGGWGAHDFYAGYTQRGIIKIILTVLGCCLIGGTASGIWAIIDICTIKEDVNGKPFAG